MAISLNGRRREARRGTFGNRCAAWLQPDAERVTCGGVSPLCKAAAEPLSARLRRPVLTAAAYAHATSPGTAAQELNVAMERQLAPTSGGRFSDNDARDGCSETSVTFARRI